MKALLAKDAQNRFIQSFVILRVTDVRSVILSALRSYLDSPSGTHYLLSLHPMIYDHHSYEVQVHPLKRQSIENKILVTIMRI